MRSLLLALTCSLLMAACSSDKYEQKPNVEADIRKAIPDLQIDAITPSPIDGLYEIQVGKGVFYTDASGKHLIAGGHIFETATHRDLTRERLETINRIDWSVLPLDKAIVSGDADAPLKLAIFTDPDCPYCKKLEGELKNMQGVKVYTFLYPLTQLHPNARAKADSIWCSKDQHQAMLDVMLEGKALPKADCQTPLDEIAAIGQKLGINGTPTLIAGDGRMMSGGKPASELKAWLANK
ncbi:MAG TPA: DsbC family protein [Mariprofundaceae bacterium]|nr:DsbC family protein [Mariprofundaceae bacterium]